MTEISPLQLHHAYRRGWFPMGDESGEVDWYQPHRRALLPITGIKVSRSLARRIARADFQVRTDTAFRDVMGACLRPEDNWITPSIIEAFCDAHAQGFAHSVEVWREGKLVGGLYGLAIGAVFSAESMFHRETDCSKIALCAAVDHCRTLGFQVFDAQIMNSHLRSLGAYEVSTEAYDEMLMHHAYIDLEWRNLNS